MSRPTAVDLLDLAAQPWRNVPMPGSNAGIELVPLASSGGLSMFARFPQGFERMTQGGYHVSEEFLVLSGEMELEGITYRRGDLTVVPAEYLRTTMAAPLGCVLLAWFGGAADFLPPTELAPCPEKIRSIALADQAGALLASDVGEWSAGSPVPSRSAETTLEVVDAGLTRWTRGSDETPPLGSFVRRDR